MVPIQAEGCWSESETYSKWVQKQSQEDWHQVFWHSSWARWPSWATSPRIRGHSMFGSWTVWRGFPGFPQTSSKTSIVQGLSYLSTGGPPCIWFRARPYSPPSPKETLCLNHHSSVPLSPYPLTPHGTWSQRGSKETFLFQAQRGTCTKR